MVVDINAIVKVEVFIYFHEIKLQDKVIIVKIIEDIDIVENVDQVKVIETFLVTIHFFEDYEEEVLINEVEVVKENSLTKG